MDTLINSMALWLFNFSLVCIFALQNSGVIYSTYIYYKIYEFNILYILHNMGHCIQEWTQYKFLEDGLYGLISA